jgi:hypothetical protein
MPATTDELIAWKRLLEPSSAELLEAAGAIDPRQVSQVQRLRRDWPAELVFAALELSEARRRAAGKFPEPDRIVADVEGIEQATSHAVAEHKARRFAALDPPLVHDLCCGIGGDAMGLAHVAPVRAVDSCPLRAWMTSINAGCPADAADVLAFPLDGAVFHLDPSRREPSGRRRHRFEDYQPGPPFVRSLLDRNADGAVKLGPGVEPDALPWPDRAELEHISEGGRLVQAVLWCGRLARNIGLRTATMLPGGLTMTGEPTSPPAAPRAEFDRFLFVPDPAIERAGLLGSLCRELGLAAPVPALGLLTGPDAVASGWLTPFEVLARMPWRPERVRSWLRAHDGGHVEIKTRGRAVDPDAHQKQLRGTGDTPYTVFALRMGRQRIAAITQRVNGD